MFSAMWTSSLESLPGCGPWTCAFVLPFADPWMWITVIWKVLVNDRHISRVGWLVHGYGLSGMCIMENKWTNVPCKHIALLTITCYHILRHSWLILLPELLVDSSASSWVTFASSLARVFISWSSLSSSPPPSSSVVGWPATITNTAALLYMKRSNRQLQLHMIQTSPQRTHVTTGLGIPIACNHELFNTWLCRLRRRANVAAVDSTGRSSIAFIT